jgi:hypothetical protein
MCRNIKTLYNLEPPATREEIREASLQYVRKISGFTKPSKANRAAFIMAVDSIATATRELLASLDTSAPPRDREVEAARQRSRAAARYASPQKAVQASESD